MTRAQKGTVKLGAREVIIRPDGRQAVIINAAADDELGVTECADACALFPGWLYRRVQEFTEDTAQLGVYDLWRTQARWSSSENWRWICVELKIPLPHDPGDPNTILLRKVHSCHASLASALQQFGLAWDVDITTTSLPVPARLEPLLNDGILLIDTERLIAPAPILAGPDGITEATFHNMDAVIAKALAAVTLIVPSDD